MEDNSQPKKAKTQRSKKKTLAPEKPKMYIMYGFKRDDLDKTAFLKVCKDGESSSHGIYKVLKDRDEATLFPSKPLDEAHAKGFGTPKQWAKFFNGEEALSGWCFHPIPASK